jgi:hypothetical protein
MKSLLRVLGLAIVILGVRLESANGSNFCMGYCTVTCESGASYVYSTRDYACCNKLSVCPDGGQAEWWPGSGAECIDPWALIC